MSTYIACQILSDPHDITEIEPLYASGPEYLVRLVLKNADSRWGVWATADASELALHIFPGEEKP